MIKLVWAFFFGCVIFGMWMIFEFGIQPKSVRVIRPSFFEKPEELGETAFKILRPRLLLHKIIAVGVQQGVSSHRSMLKGFVELAQKEQLPFDRIINISSLPTNHINFSPALYIDLTRQRDLLAQEIQKYLDEGKRILVIGNTLDLIHFHPDNETTQVEQALKQKIITIGMVELNNVPSPEGRELYKEPIAKCERTSKYVHSLGCLVEDKIKFLKSRKKIKWDKVVGVMDQEGERDFVLYSN